MDNQQPSQNVIILEGSETIMEEAKGKNPML